MYQVNTPSYFENVPLKYKLLDENWEIKLLLLYDAKDLVTQKNSEFGLNFLSYTLVSEIFFVQILYKIHSYKIRINIQIFLFSKENRRKTVGNF